MARRTPQSTTGSNPKPQRRWQEWVVVGAAGLVGLFCLLVAGVLFMANRGGNDLRRVAVSDVLAPLSAGGVGEEPVNVLVVGMASSTAPGSLDPLDSGAFDAGQEVTTAMVLRVDPQTRSVAMLGVPAGTTITNRTGTLRTSVQAAVREGGPAALIEGVGATLQIPIHRYMSVSIEDLAPVVDDLGGIPLFVPYPMRDRAGFSIDGAGCVIADGATAAMYLASTDLEGNTADGWTNLEASGAQTRVARDRDVISSMLRQVPAGWSELRASSAAALTAADALVVDDGAARGELLDLVGLAADYSADQLYAFDLPADLDGAEGDLVLGVFRPSSTGPAAADGAGLRPGTATLRSMSCRTR